MQKIHFYAIKLTDTCMFSVPQKSKIFSDVKDWYFYLKLEKKWGRNYCFYITTFSGLTSWVFWKLNAYPLQMGINERKRQLVLSSNMFKYKVWDGLSSFLKNCCFLQEKGGHYFTLYISIILGRHGNPKVQLKVILLLKY